MAAMCGLQDYQKCHIFVVFKLIKLIYKEILDLEDFGGSNKTSLLRRLQAQTLPDATPPIDKIHPFSKMAVTFEPIMEFLCPSGFRKF